jgi:hypothetical protein
VLEITEEDYARRRGKGKKKGGDFGRLASTKLCFGLYILLFLGFL